MYRGIYSCWLMLKTSDFMVEVWSLQVIVIVMIDSNLVEKSEVDVQQRVKDFEFFEQWVFVTPQQVTDPERLEHADAQGFHQVRDDATD